MTHPDGPQASAWDSVLTKRDRSWLSQRDLDVHHVEIKDNTRRSGLSHTDPIGMLPRLLCYQWLFSVL